jgi:GNAT superfamily N-acetyltransferase
MVDYNLVVGIEDWNDNKRLVGIGITVPSLARAVQKCRKGRLLPFGWWHVLRALKFHKTKVVDLMLIGILPEYRAKGANALMFAELIPWYQKYGFEWGETNVEMETNENVQKQWEALSPIHHKSRRCYKKILTDK